MLRDLRAAIGAIPEHYDICIVGAGAAGIALALEFVGRRERVCLVEAGGLDFEPDIQDLYLGKVVGHQYAELDACRLRYFGGTTNHWAGYCSPILGYSFEPAAWIPHSGWPIGRPDLDPYYERAREMLGLESTGWSAAGGWDAAAVQAERGDPALPFDPTLFEDRAYVIEPVRMGEQYRTALEQAENIDVLLHANLREILVDEAARTVVGLDVRTLDGVVAAIRARYVVVAAGGIENARLLLASTSVQTEGLGNGNDLVGRFFSDHAHIDAALLQLADRSTNLTLYERREFGRSRAILFKDITRAAQEAHRLTSGGVQIDALAGESVPGLTALKTIVSSGRQGEVPDEFGRHLRDVIGNIGPLAGFGVEYARHGRPLVDRAALTFHLDPAPNPDSRVRLGGTLDALGMPRVELDWRFTETDERTFRWMAETFAAEAALNGLGRVRLDFDWTDFADVVFWHYHNIGTTRMAEDPKQGVVDGQCKVHGTDNLFMAGSSVFVSSGAGSPTFTIVALAIRLADHLKSRLQA
jgi:choline dehydrogenase-like flavoprotein